MTRIRSPGYPSIGVGQAIEIVRKLYDKVRKNPIDREAAAKELGYSGMTGMAAKMLSNLNHFGLIEKAGKGDLRVTDLAVEALYGHPEFQEARRYKGSGVLARTLWGDQRSAPRRFRFRARTSKSAEARRFC